MPDPHIDLSYLERLYKGDQARIAQWIHIYLEEAPAQFERLSDSLEKNNAEGLAAAAHELRPQAHYVGAARMLELLVAIGQRARTDGATACAEIVGELRSIGTLVDDELRAVITTG
ncbi:MAG: Hpt domain-containing protein [Flavobacteriales bacterium]|nr:Hpt domain-containing protein [Flavobacteriales bacterium]